VAIEIGAYFGFVLPKLPAPTMLDCIQKGYTPSRKAHRAKRGSRPSQGNDITERRRRSGLKRLEVQVPAQEAAIIRKAAAIHLVSRLPCDSGRHRRPVLSLT
jgi:hypothetical protein